MREYERTHPWIRFRSDLRAAPVELWMLLGEARSKCEHIAGVPLLPAVANRLHRLYLATGVAATTAIEGNTLSEAQVVEHLEGRLRLPPSKQHLAMETILAFLPLRRSSAPPGEQAPDARPGADTTSTPNT